MKVSEVSLEDGKTCAFLINFLRSGRWDVSGEEMDKMLHVRRWVNTLALSMAEQVKGLPGTTTAVEALKPIEGMRIKSQGKLPVPQAKLNKYQKKKK